MSKNKNSKVKSVSPAARPATPSLSARLSKTGGRIVGITTKSGNKFNGQIKSVSPSYVTMFDRNQRKQVKFALTSITNVTGV